MLIVFLHPTELLVMTVFGASMLKQLTFPCFLSWSNSIPLYMWNTTLHSTQDGYFGCSPYVHVLISAVLNVGLDVSLWCTVFSRCTARCVDSSVISGSYVQFHKDPLSWASLWSLPIYTPTDSAGDFCFLSTLSCRVFVDFEDVPTSRFKISLMGLLKTCFSLASLIRSIVPLLLFHQNSAWIHHVKWPFCGQLCFPKFVFH